MRWCRRRRQDIIAICRADSSERRQEQQENECSKGKNTTTKTMWWAMTDNETPLQTKSQVKWIPFLSSCRQLLGKRKMGLHTPLRNATHRSFRTWLLKLLHSFSSALSSYKYIFIRRSNILIKYPFGSLLWRRRECFMPRAIVRPRHSCHSLICRVYQLIFVVVVARSLSQLFVHSLWWTDTWYMLHFVRVPVHSNIYVLRVHMRRNFIIFLNIKRRCSGEWAEHVGHDHGLSKLINVQDCYVDDHWGGRVIWFYPWVSSSVSRVNPHSTVDFLILSL